MKKILAYEFATLLLSFFSVSAPVLLNLSVAQPYPVTVENCGTTLTFDKAPGRVVTTYSVTTELMLRLGLQGVIVGAAAFGEPMPDNLQSAYDNLNLIGADYLIPKEVMLSLEPDFVFDNSPENVYDGSTGNATREELADAGAQIYTLTAKCEGSSEVRLEDIYSDLENIGKIFNVADEAQKLITEMQTTLQNVQERVAGQEPLQVLIYESGEGPFTIYGTGPWDAVLRAAGGENAIADLNVPYTQLSSEEMASRDYDAILLIEYDGNAQQRANILFETFPNSEAAKNKRAIIVPYELLNPGVRNHLGAEIIARGLYPEAFE
jgi:iron complex transport system substrate-binding protein